MNSKITKTSDILFTFLLVICSLHCLASSFNISIDSLVVAMGTAMFTVIFAILAYYEKNGVKYTISMGVIFIVFALVVIFSWNIMSAQLNYAVNCLLKEYSEFLPVAQSVNFASLRKENATALFVALSLPVSGLLTIFIMRLRLLSPAVIVSLIVIVPCFILVNTPPDILPLLTMFAVLFTMLITSAIHRVNTFESGAVSSVVALLMAVLVTVVYILNPVEGYERSDWQEELLDTITYAINNKDFDVLNPFDLSVESIETEVDLSNAGPMEQKHQKVMTITSPYSGEIYLKGIAYANYDDNKWSILTDEQAKGYPANFKSSTMTRSYEVVETTINIITEKKESILYIPYYLSSDFESNTEVYDVLIKNNAKTKDYNISLQPFTTDLYSILWGDSLSSLSNPYNFRYIHNDINAEYREFVYENYLSVPENTKAELVQYAQNNGFANMSKEYVVDIVREYVTTSASYSLDTPKVPQGEDISVWLLNESETGYCVHFATTAALMLRSLGIPARYVTGYYVYAEWQKPTVVTSDNAHAWVEYFDEYIGWVPLEATPSDFSRLLDTAQADIVNPTQSPTQTVQQEVTQPTTQQATATTQPSTENRAQTATQPTGELIENTTTTAFRVVIVVIAVIVATILILVLRRIIILSLRKHLVSTGKRNNRAKYYYRYLVKASKYSHIAIPKEIDSIVEKARFSNSRISKEELDIIITFAQSREKSILSDVSLIKKVYFKYILALA